MEMVITSLRPSQLVAGKVMGITMLSLTQIAIWAIGVITAAVLLLAGEVDLGSISLTWNAGMVIYAYKTLETQIQAETNLVNLITGNVE